MEQTLSPKPTRTGSYSEAENRYCAHLLKLSSGFFYVGSTGRLRKRINDHRANLNNGLHKNRKLQEAYDSCADRYDVSLTVLWTDTRQEAYAKEQWLLDLFFRHPVFSRFLCNVAPSSTNAFFASETLARMSLSHQGRGCGEDNSRHGIQHTEASKKLMSDVKCSNNLRGENSKLFGRTRSEETLEKLKRAQIDRSKSVTLNGQTYSSIREAARMTGIPRSTIKLHLRKQTEEVT